MSNLHYGILIIIIGVPISLCYFFLIPNKDDRKRKKEEKNWVENSFMNFSKEEYLTIDIIKYGLSYGGLFSNNELKRLSHVIELLNQRSAARYWQFTFNTYEPKVRLDHETLITVERCFKEFINTSNDYTDKADAIFIFRRLQKEILKNKEQNIQEPHSCDKHY